MDNTYRIIRDVFREYLRDIHDFPGDGDEHAIRTTQELWERLASAISQADPTFTKDN